MSETTDVLGMLLFYTNIYRYRIDLLKPFLPMDAQLFPVPILQDMG
jgi:hypothetical protein